MVLGLSPSISCLCFPEVLLLVLILFVIVVVIWVTEFPALWSSLHPSVCLCALSRVFSLSSQCCHVCVSVYLSSLPVLCASCLLLLCVFPSRLFPIVVLQVCLYCLSFLVSFIVTSSLVSACCALCSLLVPPTSVLSFSNKDDGNITSVMCSIHYLYPMWMCLPLGGQRKKNKRDANNM